MPVSMSRCVQSYWKELLDIPRPGIEWTYQTDRFDFSQQTLRTLKSAGVVEAVGKTHKGDTYYTIWKTNEKAYSKIQERYENSEQMLPCCVPSWIKNERGVDGITCGACGTVHNRDDVK